MNARQKAKYYKKKYEELVKLYAPTKADYYFGYVNTLNVNTLVVKRTVPDNKLWNKNVRESVEKQIAGEIINELKRGYDDFINFEIDYDSFKNCHVVEARLRVVGREQMIETIISEMTKGNFSFAILVVGIAQLIVMIRKK